MRKSILLTLTLLFLVFSVAFFADDSKSFNTNECKQLIKVIDDNGSPVQSASVVVKEHPNGDVIGTCTTDITGYCPNEMNLLQGQSYIVLVTLNPGPGGGSTVFTACVSPEVVVEAK